jgi:hypothetical protein
MAKEGQPIKSFGKPLFPGEKPFLAGNQGGAPCLWITGGMDTQSGPVGHS